MIYKIEQTLPNVEKIHLEERSVDITKYNKHRMSTLLVEKLIELDALTITERPSQFSTVFETEILVVKSDNIKPVLEAVQMLKRCVTEPLQMKYLDVIASTLINSI